MGCSVAYDAIKNFDEAAAVTYFNTFHDNSGVSAFSYSHNYHCTFNPIDKIIELYEALVKSEKEKVELLQKIIDK